MSMVVCHGGENMICLTKKDTERTRFFLNHRLIERIETTNDTIILLDSGKKIIVDETPEEIIKKIVEFESRIMPNVINKKDVEE